MNTLALVLVLFSAVLHASWNLLAKRIGGGASLVWLYDSVSCIVYAPLALFAVFFQHNAFSMLLLLFIAGSAIFHLAYFVLLQLGYRAGDLSLVYPLARGTGPLLSTIAAMLLLGERPTLLAGAGILLIIAGVFLITGGTRVLKTHALSGALLFGIVTGIFIAVYTLWDKVAVSRIQASPVLYYYGATLIRVSLLTPYSLLRWQEVRSTWSTHRFRIIGIGVLSPLAYLLLLTAFTLAPVSLVAPAREISVLLGTLMGARLHSEGETKRRMLAASLILLGIIALAV
ncbi:MAG: EamA family transporter [Ktedonobacteraceae bacterium]|nr:EamA family transporter [Ktedonobacteraceae bacterium]